VGADDERGHDRRAFLKGAGVAGLLAFVPPARWAAERAAATRTAHPGRAGRFLTAHELDTLRSVTARFLPGPPEDADPGALEAGCAEAIDMLLGAFTFHPPLIHAGGPFSNRSGARHDDIADFVALDREAELGWRIRLEGTRGKPERAFAGDVKGLQQEYRDGLAALDAKARPAHGDFASAPSAVQDAILRDAALADFAGTALSDTLDAMLGLPEYGGNRRRAGWRLAGWPGDVQPRGYTDGQVSGADPASTRSMDAVAARAALQRYLPGLEDLG
jgi:hypothetical protein